MNVSDFNYKLPEELIAQRPAEKRDASRLLVIHRDTGALEHKTFHDILSYFQPGDCLVLNDSKVIPARLFGIKKDTGARVEFLLSRRLQGDTWETLVRPGRRVHPGDRILFGEHGELEAIVTERGEEGTRIVEFHYAGNFMDHLEAIGKIPLPPYIARETTPEDKVRYQTVYCQTEGSVAAPTAGLHFTPELLEQARAKGIRIANLTLHVGLGTFRPVKCDQVEAHVMHFEDYAVSREAADLVNETKAAGGRIISVGTTACRTMESATDENGVLQPGEGSTGIFIYPGYRFKMVDSMITNFHLPKSTLLMLVSALYDRENMLRAYEVAVKERYRFFSYGDATLIL
ncbi:MAG TPA: tRNA preQ1(34) S-adenosylmethionine ribosyltransferase-isomerase QueA [Clostridiales bacterium]|nr:tRNA preQ1(34) S-adenosylmethionine ribosyltransferase-isomerase QueA [Clostridiales bacterium]